MSTKRSIKLMNLFVILLLLIGPVMNRATPVSAQDRAGGVVELDGSVSSQTATSGSSSISFSHTTGTGENRLMLVGISWNSGTSAHLISSVVFSYDTTEEVAFDEVITQVVNATGSNSGPRYAAIYSSAEEPPQNTPGTITVTFDSSVQYGIASGAANFKGVDQTTPLGTPVGDSATSQTGSDPSVVLTGLVGDELVFDTMFIGGNQTLAIGADQVSLWQGKPTATTGAASIEQAVSDTVTMSWDSDTDNWWALAAVPINPTSVTSSVEASAIPSDEAPTVGDTITVTINIDMSGMLAPDDRLGSFTASLSWDSAVLSYVSNSGILAGYTGAINPGSDFINFNGAQTTGATGSIDVFMVTFDVIGAGDAELDLSFSVLAADTEADLLGFLTIDDGSVVAEGLTAQVTVDGAVSSNTADDVSSISFSHTTGTGDDRLLLVGISWNCGTTDRSISNVQFSYDTTDLTLDEVLTEQTGTQYRYAAIYSLVDAPYNQSGTVTVTFSGSVGNGIVAGAINFQDVDTADPFETSDGDNANDDAPAVTLTGLDGDELVFDTVFQGASDESQTLTAGADQTEQWNAWIANTRAAASTEQAAGSSVEMSWTAGSSSYRAIVAVAINPAPLAPPDHTVTFDANGGTGTMSPQVANEPTALTANAFSRSGYSFNSWNTDAGGAGTAYADGATYDFSASITLYAQWDALPMQTVTFDANGGTGTMSPQSANVPTALMANAFTRSGYSFNSWNTDAGGAGTAYADGATYDFSASITLYAQWDALPMQTVTFDANGGTGTMSPQSANVPTALTANTFTLEGFFFTGWNTDAGGAGTAYADGATYDFSASITLYAQWDTLPLQTVTFDANGGTGMMSPQSANVPTALTANAFTRLGYSFDGWNTASDGSGVDYADEEEYDFSASITLYAQWDALPMQTVTFDANGGTGTMSPQSANVPTALTANAFTRLGYSFDGWNTASDGSGVDYADEEEYDFSASITLYAQWDALPMQTVTFDANGGTGTMSPQSANVPTALNANTFTRTGFDFVEWNTDVGGSGTAYADGAMYAFDNDVTLYAQWVDVIPESVVASAIPSDETPDVGDTITITINIDMTNMDPPDDLLGSFTSSLSWNPAILSYVSNSGLLAGYTGAINPGSGLIQFNGAQATGVGGSIDVFTITYDVIGVGDAALNLGFTAMAADTGNSIMDHLTINQGSVAAEGVEGVVELVSSSSGIGDGTDVISFAHTTGTGANRLMLVGISWNSGDEAENIESVVFSFDSTDLALTEVITEQVAVSGTVSGPRFAAIYSLLNPPSGQAGTITITFDDTVSNGVVAGAATFSGVNQTVPLGTPVGDHSEELSSPGPSVTLTSLSGNELVFDNTFLGGSDDSYELEVGADQTELWNDFDTNARGAASIEQAASPVTMSWTPSEQNWWAQVAVPINPALGGVTYFDLAISVNPSGAGTTNPAIGVHTYQEDSIVDITASPLSGYEFDEWSGACTGSGACQVTMTGNLSVTANFNSVTVPITFPGEELLGRPTDESISIKIVPDEAISYYYEYGTTSGVYTQQSGTTTATAGDPSTVVISGLAADTEYFYRMQYSTNGGSSWIARSELSFHTQRAEGSTFTFDITTDNHVNIVLGDPDTWEDTLNDVANDDPDFLIDLGDTFDIRSLDEGDVAGAENSYEFQLPFFNIVSGSTPIFLVPGNHEQQEAWHLDAIPIEDSLSVIGVNAQKKYFLNPVPDGSFYDGDESTLAAIDGDQFKEDYYSWTWGDALFIVISPYWYTETKPYVSDLGGGEDDWTGSGDSWDWTLGQDQYDWLKATLENSDASYKYIFMHQLVLDGSFPSQIDYGHGGANFAHLYEWGGYNEDGTTWGWDTERPGWEDGPIHQVLLDNGVSAVFHAHDHQYAYEMLDGIVYQLVPSGGFDEEGFGQYTTGDGTTIVALDNPGHLRVTVSPEETCVEYIQTGATSSAYTYCFEPQAVMYDLDIDVDPSGSGTTDPAVGTHNYEENEVVPITATPAYGYEFDHWSGACTGEGACEVTMDEEKSVTAHFVPVQFSLTIGVEPSGSGTTVPSEGVHAYDYGSIVDITATAEVGFEFAYWSGDCDGTGACQVTIDDDTSVVAHFTQTTFNLTIIANPAEGGTTIPSVGVHPYLEDTEVAVIAIPAEGYEFDSWSGDCTGTGPCSLTMDSDKTVTANFVQIMFDLTINTDPSGGGTTDPPAGVNQYAYGSVVPITAIPAENYSFVEWTGDCTGTDPCELEMLEDKEVTAHFELMTHELVIEVEPALSGTTSPAVGTHVYVHGSIVEIIPTPAEGYQFAYWSGDCNGTGACEVTIDEDMYVMAHFAFLTYDLTINIDPEEGGTTNPATGVHPYLDGSSVLVLAEPAAGYIFDHWSGDCTGTGLTCSLTMDSNKTIQANFIGSPKACYALTLSFSGNGAPPVADPTNSVGCDLGTYIPGETINLSNAKPVFEWHIASWYGTQNDTSTEATNVVIMPEGDIEAGVNYETYFYIPFVVGLNY